MKCLRILAMMAIAVLAGACDKDEPTDPPVEPVTVTDGTYVGTLTVDQNDGTVYTQENVSIEFETEEGIATIKMVQVSFSSRMPLKLDMTIPDITAAEAAEGLSLSGDVIVPLAMGGPFPAYTITGLTGEATPQAISLEMMCGDYPLTFTGKIVEE